MKNIRISSLGNYEQFKEVCSFFRLEDEYPGWTGSEKYGIITELNEMVLLAEYPAIMNALSPYIILDAAFAGIRNEFVNCDRRFKRNQETTESMFAFDEETEYHHAELLCPDFADGIIDKEALKSAMSRLTAVQRRRVEQYFFQEMSVYAISRSENGSASPKSVWESIQRALKQMKKII